MIDVSISSLVCHRGYHHELVRHPPKNVNYHPEDVDKIIPMEAVFNESDWGRFIQFGQFRETFYYIPYLLNPKQLIHSTLIPVVNKVPHVIDMDSFFYPYLINAHEFGLIIQAKKPFVLTNKLPPKLKTRLEKTKKFLKSNFCKKILPWSKWCQGYIMDLIDDPEIVKKIELLYPAVYSIDYKKRRHENIRLLYIGRTFDRKGGLEILKAFEILRRDYNNIQLIYIGEMSKNAYDKYNKYKNIKLYAWVKRNELIEIYKKSDIFVSPTKIETFGFCLLEAMNFSLPIVTTKGKFVPVSREIVDDGSSGFLIELNNSSDSNCIVPTINFDDFIAKLRLLIEDKELRERMGRAGKNKIVDGKFSIKKRNKRLKEIYEEALK